jgi:hypothetical protein
MSEHVSTLILMRYGALIQVLLHARYLDFILSIPMCFHSRLATDV